MESVNSGNCDSAVVTFRGSEMSQLLRDQWLSESLWGHMGPGKDLFVRPAAYRGGAHKEVLVSVVPARACANRQNETTVCDVEFRPRPTLNLKPYRP